ncbi:MAG: 4Fe-4S ferredoxin iron-sulfur binding domain-containing protein [Candidatus Aramenus sulfurataquae]|uniref:4Fe-4S ferredoxin iron-sulfur binding domain-containing protein n=2 Tax=Candidatus Aramenus sulfurataquae TaxID=1326980 RepID=W7KI44_9CREN|nr:MAG: 4Fe-4S ferredoxin iron-sulfur binding domain-containing protein [Candidatus Aramenus sulfurataquae]
MNEESLLFSALSPTVVSFPPEIVTKIRGEEDLKVLSDFVPRYETFRGVEGKKVADLTGLRGIEDLGDKLRVLAGTKWKEVLKFNPEVYCISDFSVGGSIQFEDACFGYNEFGKINNRVKVEAYLNGEKYKGKYRGGIVYSIFINKETRPLMYKVLEGDYLYLANKAREWFITSFPVFRDVTLIKEGNRAKLYVAYPSIREALLRGYLVGFSDADKYKLPVKDHKFRYVGTVPLLNFNPKDFANVTNLYLLFRKGEVTYYAFSHSPLVLEYNRGFSDVNDRTLFNNCILCGRCVDVCPHAEQRGSIAYSPLGFYVLSYYNQGEKVANCHMCSKCVSVCPAGLDIVGDLKKRAKSNNISQTVNLDLPAKKVIAITPISSGLVEYALKVIKLLGKEGLKVGLITLNVGLDDMIKGNFSGIANQIRDVDEVITLTPEEAYYLSELKKVKIIDVTFVYEYLKGKLKDKMKELRVHVPCFANYKFDNADTNCSFELLNMVNGEGYGKKVPKADVSLCPLASKRLGIRNLTDLLSVTLDYSAADKLIEDFNVYSNSFSKILEDVKWYEGVADDVKGYFELRMVESFVKGRSRDELLLFYLNKDKYADKVKNKNLFEKLVSYAKKELTT